MRNSNISNFVICADKHSRDVSSAGRQLERREMTTSTVQWQLLLSQNLSAAPSVDCGAALTSQPAQIKER